MIRGRLGSILVLVAMQSACVARSPHSEDRTLGQLRDAANSAGAADRTRRDAALAELVAPGGNVARGAAVLERLRTGLHDDVRVLWALAVVEHSHGEFERSARDYAATIDAARSSTDPWAPALAENAIGNLVGLRGDIDQFESVFQPMIENVVRAPGRLGAAATTSIIETAVRWARERGLHDAETRWVRATGCATAWTVVGAFGPLPMLRFDETLPPESTTPLASSYDLGPDRGRRAPWTIRARGCAANLGRGRSETGVFFAASDYVLDRDRDVVLHAESPNPFVVLVDGARVAVLDSRRRPGASSANVPMHLVAGRHTVRVKLASRFASPLLVVSIVDGGGLPVGAWETASSAANPQAPWVPSPLAGDIRGNVPTPHDPFEQFILAEFALTRRDPITARESLRRLADDPHATPLALQSWGSVALDDPSSPANFAHDRTRHAFDAERSADPAAYYPYLVLARLAGNDNRADDALQITRDAARRFPDNPEVQSELADRLADRGWDGEALEILSRAAVAHPSVCWPWRMQLAIAQRHGDGVSEHAIAEHVRGCDALADSLALTELRERHWNAAQSEYQRLLTDDPEGRGLRVALFGLARERGNLTLAAPAAEAILDENPEDLALREDLVDIQLALGHETDAIALMDHETARAPAQMWELLRVQAAVEQRALLEPWRRDGTEVLRAFDASGHHYDAAAVLVLDYTVRRQLAGGSALELTHNIIRLQSQEGVDNHATFTPPEGAVLLTLRTHKADGRILEPDSIARLDAIAFPDVHIGDSIEFEYIRSLAPVETAPGGFISERFYFRGFDIPYDHSEMVLVAPRALADALVVDPRGPAPTAVRRDLGDALTEYRWFVNQSQRMTPEPRSIAAREFVPSVDMAVGSTWNHFVDAIRDRLADQDPIDPQAVRLAAEIVGASTLATDQLSKLHRWVIDHIEQQGAGTPFASAPVMLTGRSGNRARVLCYLLGLRNIPCSLALVRQGGSDATEGRIAEDDSYPSVVLRATTERGEQWVATTDRGAPVDWMPPALAGQPGLLIAEGAPRIRIPPLNLDAHLRAVSVHVNLARDGSGRADVVEHLHGAWAVGWREQLRQIDRANLDHEFESYVGGEVTAASLTSLHIDGEEDPAADLVLHYQFAAPSFASPTGNGLEYDGIYLADLGARYAQVPERTTTMYDSEALNASLDLMMTVADGLTVGELPADAGADADGVSWRFHYERTPTGFRATRSVRIPPGRVTPEAYPRFVAQIRAIETADHQRIEIRAR